MKTFEKALVWIAVGFVLLVVLIVAASIVVINDCGGNPAYAKLYVEIFWRELKVVVADRIGEVLRVVRGIPSLILQFLLWPVPCCPVPLLLVVGAALTYWFVREQEQSGTEDERVRELGYQAYDPRLHRRGNVVPIENADTCCICGEMLGPARRRCTICGRYFCGENLILSLFECLLFGYSPNAQLEERECGWAVEHDGVPGGYYTDEDGTQRYWTSSPPHSTWYCAHHEAEARAHYERLRRRK